MSKAILIVRIPVDFESEIKSEWFEEISNEYYIIILYDKHLSDIQFEYPKNCDLPKSELEKIKGAVLVK